jgi:3-oxoacyl-[acyl-carrier protein] reductase
LLKGQRILITGANGGIGQSISEILLQNNAKVVLFYNEKRTQIDKLLEKYGNSSIEIYQVNLLDSEQLENTMNLVLNHDKIDSFIHSVSLMIENKSIMNTKWKNYESHIEMQTKSFLQIVQSLILPMKSQKHGKIISILTSSVVGRPPSNMSDYIVGKYSLLGLSKSMSVELGHLGITVNSISPSMTITPLIEKFPTKMKEISASQTPLGRLAEPIDTASVALFLCSKYSDYMTGQNLLVSGGQVMY